MLAMIGIYVTILVLIFSDPMGLPVGAKAPDFEGIDQTGKRITLEGALQGGPVVLTFFRGSWCRYCIKQLKDYQDSLSQFAAKNATLIAVTPEKEEGIEKTVSITEATFSIIHDVDLTIMDNYKVIDKDKVEDYRSTYANMEEDHSKKFLPVPATYIIDENGKITFVYFDPNYRLRVSNKLLLEQL
jgi:peroxiredoxin